MPNAGSIHKNHDKILNLIPADNTLIPRASLVAINGF